MINAIIKFCIRNRMLVLFFYAIVVVVGIYCLRNTPMDAIPDLSENFQIVFTDWPGRSPQDVEDQITYPLSVQLQGLAGVKTVRSTSDFGFSVVNIIFEDGVDYYFARERILERLSLATSFLPPGVVPYLAPDETALGQIFWYTVEGEGYDLGELRAIQDWYVRYQLNSVPGVAEVASVGGFVKEYQIDVDPNKLVAYNIRLSEVFKNVMASNRTVGAKVIEQNDMEYLVRGLGWIETLEDIENIVVGSRDNIPIFVKNIANVQVGPAFRRNVLEKNGSEVTGGVVIMRYGEDALSVIKRVKEKIKELKPGLPPGVEIVPAYDRTDLIHRSIGTLEHTLIHEAIIALICIGIFLMHFPSTIIIVLTLPLAILISFTLMYPLHVTANIMSLSGIAISIGVLVDASIVITENAFRNLTLKFGKKKVRGDIRDTVLESSKLVGTPIFFSVMIMLLSFAPIFALRGIEGRLFHPLAFTFVMAMIGTAIISITLVPVLGTLMIKGRLLNERENPVVRFFMAIYNPVLRKALRFKWVTIGLTVALIGAAVFLSTLIGREFMPPLDEGSILDMPVSLPSASITRVAEDLKKRNALIRTIPEVDMVLGKAGRAETPTDPAPLEMIETIITLKPKKEWRKGMTKEKIIQELDTVVRIPGWSNIWTQPIINRVDMLATGIRTQVGAKIFGSDLYVLEDLADQVGDILRTVPGAADIYPEKIVGENYLEIDIDRAEAARYGINLGDVHDVIEVAMGGKTVTWTVEGRERFPVRIRYGRELRTDVDSIKRILVDTVRGAQIPLYQIADIRVTPGPTKIKSEDGLLSVYVLFNARGRDVVGLVEEAKKDVYEKVDFPPGYFVVWSGQYEHQMRAKKTLMFIMPIVILIMFMLLYITFNSFADTLIIMLAVPAALTGGMLLLFFMGYNFSVAVWVGFIALFGISVETGVVMVVFLREALERKGSENIKEKKDVTEAIMEGASLRLRPKLLTVSTTFFALLPMLWATGTGSEIMRPLAVPMIGGIITSDVVVLLVIPVLYHMWMEFKLLPRKRPKKGKKRGWFGKKKKLASTVTGGSGSPGNPGEMK
ncbi:MAG: CusA/CzcA family heavy metal efflux RND transporter [Candidatus Brocadiales bacterium]|nr:CusA/CzcA family heavy metal efflux RND transporter [Candidatus Bathyanammoxibius amoris]